MAKMNTTDTTTSIISGEAAETDSEDENNDYNNDNKSSKMSTSIQGEIITGEDSESDTELHSPTNLKKDPAPSVPIKKKFDSLLHKKLVENNTTVYNNIHSFFNKEVNQANTSLNDTERNLMKSQLTLQAALNSLRLLNANAEAIKNTLKYVVIDDNYLHNLVSTPTSSTKH